ncbi:MAG: carboxypeptidase regulatory-like domain-containing protein [Gemmatimonadaceae bacterium]|nr:carboxypeptidase regulatory-like domain-containing protein [Gemmatimonadaceae bacterium]
MQAQSVGGVTGRVEAKDTRAVLPGARLTIVGTASAAVTDQSGEFRFARLPVGTHLLRVTYLGRCAAVA